MTNHELELEIEALQASIRRGHADLSAGKVIDLRDLERTADMLGARLTLTDATPRDALRRQLIGMLADLDGLSREIRGERRKVSEYLGQSDAYRKAVSAYGLPTPVR